MMLHNSLLIFIASFKHKKSYQRVSPGKSAADSNLLLHSPSLTPDTLADCIQWARQTPADGARQSHGEGRGVRGGFCGVARAERRREA